MSARIILAALLALPGVGFGQPELAPMLKRMEQRYNSARTIRLRFEQTYATQGRPPRTERGELFLRKPGRMRWEYSQPAGKLFLSDGKYIYFYTPSTNRVEKSKLKESDDLRAPLAFLLGKLDFNRDFGRYRTRPSGDSTIVVAEPRSDRLPYSQVEFTVAPDYRITRLVVSGRDESVSEFRFAAETVNTNLAAALFEFRMPAGAQFVESSERAEP